MLLNETVCICFKFTILFSEIGVFINLNTKQWCFDCRLLRYSRFNLTQYASAIPSNQNLYLFHYSFCQLIRFQTSLYRLDSNKIVCPTLFMLWNTSIKPLILGKTCIFKLSKKNVNGFAQIFTWEVFSEIKYCTKHISNSQYFSSSSNIIVEYAPGRAPHDYVLLLMSLMRKLPSVEHW